MRKAVCLIGEGADDVLILLDHSCCQSIDSYCIWDTSSDIRRVHSIVYFPPFDLKLCSFVFLNMVEVDARMTRKGKC